MPSSPAARPLTIYPDVIPCQHDSPIATACISSNGMFGVTACPDGGPPRLFALRGALKGQVNHLQKSGARYGASCISVGNDIYSATFRNPRVTHVRRLLNSQRLLTKKHDKSPIGAKLSRDGSRLFSCTSTKISLTNVASRSDYSTFLETHKRICRFDINATATRIFLLIADELYYDRLSIRVLNDNFMVLTESTFFIEGNLAHSPCISSDSRGDQLAIADDNSLRIWRVGREIISLPNYSSEPKQIKYCALSSDGMLVVSTTRGKDFYAWDCFSKTQIAKLRGSQKVRPFPKNEREPFRTGACAISEDGDTAIGGCTDGSVHVWPLYLAGDQEWRQLRAHACKVCARRFQTGGVLTVAEMKTVFDALAASTGLQPVPKHHIRSEVAFFGGNMNRISEPLFLQVLQSFYNGQRQN